MLFLSVETHISAGCLHVRFGNVISRMLQGEFGVRRVEPRTRACWRCSGECYPETMPGNNVTFMQMKTE